MVNVKEEFIETLEDTPKYRIDLVNVTTFGSPEKMYKLTLKIHDEQLFILRRTAWDFYLKELKEMGESLDLEKGFFSDYGKGDPLQEFNLDDEFTMFTVLAPLSPRISRFRGNHKRYSGVFRYFIWDPTLKDQIAKKLEEAVFIDR